MIVPETSQKDGRSLAAYDILRDKEKGTVRLNRF